MKWKSETCRQPPSWFIISFPSSGSTFLPTLLVPSHLTSRLWLPITCVQRDGATGPATGLGIEWVGRDGGWDFPAHHSLALLPVGLLIPPPTSSHGHCSQASLPLFPPPGLPHTLALGHAGGAIKVSACVSWTAGAEVLTEVRLIGTHGTADTAMDAGVVVVTRGALDCRQGGKVGVKIGKWEFWGIG